MAAARSTTTRSLRGNHPAGALGFSLVELLVASVIGSLVVVAAAMVLGPHLRLNQRMEGYTRLQDRWMRVAFLLDTEIQKASSISVGTNSLTLTVPVSGGSLPSTIIYYQQGTTLLRSGPTIDDNGNLQPASPTTGVVVVDGVAAGGFQPQLKTANSGLTLDYAINLFDPNSDATYNGRGSVARGRADCRSLETDTLGQDTCL